MTVTSNHGNGANQISPRELILDGQSICLGSGSYGRCYLKTYTRLGIQIVEKQICDSSLPDIMKEVQIMQILVHANIPTVIGIQCEAKPFSIIMEYIGDGNSSTTLDKLIKLRSKLGCKDWLSILYNVTDALHYMHTKGFLHCDLKTNNIVLCNNKGYLIDFGKTRPITSLAAKKYTLHYPHIAPEVLNGSPCTIQSDTYSLGLVFSKIGLSQNIEFIKKIADNCLNGNPSQRSLPIGILAELATNM